MGFGCILPFTLNLGRFLSRPFFGLAAGPREKKFAGELLAGASYDTRYVSYALGVSHPDSLWVAYFFGGA
jgi:hypothetical protein